LWPSAKLSQTSGPTKPTHALQRQIERMGVLRAGKLLRKLA